MIRRHILTLLRAAVSRSAVSPSAGHGRTPFQSAKPVEVECTVEELVIAAEEMRGRNLEGWRSNELARHAELVACGAQDDPDDQEEEELIRSLGYEPNSGGLNS